MAAGAPQGGVRVTPAALLLALLVLSVVALLSVAGLRVRWVRKREPAVVSVTLTATCPECGDSKTFTLDGAAVESWRAGMHAQRAFPELNAEDRERLISGFCPPCWDELWPDESNDVEWGEEA